MTSSSRPPKAYISWSSGKDSAYALHEARSLGLAEVVGAITTISEAYDRVAMHGVRASLLDRQMAALGIPSVRVMLPSPCSNEIYEARFGEACERLKAKGVRHIVFGDLYLEDIRAYRERQLAALGMTGIFPLWRRDTPSLARAMIASGLIAYLTCVDPRRLDASFAGREFDDRLLEDLPPCVDPCGENGEFHTVVSAGPMFAAPIAVRVGEVVERDGFVFADVLPD
ncbi:MAG TPA: hypothetical protein VNY70_03105 [Steroidobacteraceae bacterium]|nr:hypothetical protein [Steroidobacteraceae bacterium]